MEVTAINKLISKLLKEGKFVVPNFQREYDWDNENIEEFLYDIEEIEEEEHYFIGHMVFEGQRNGKEFKIIDGQQRLTTIMILLCAIRDRFLELNEDGLADRVNDYIFGVDDNNTKFPILENKMPYPVLQSRVLLKPNERDNSVKPVRSGEKKILNTYKKIVSKLSDYDKEKLIVYRTKILNLETIFVLASDLSDASTIFMTLNAKGKDLTALDLTKNLIFSQYHTLPGLDQPNDDWKKIIDNVGDSGKFLNRSYASRYKKVSDAKLYKSIELTVKELNENNKDGTKLFLSQLLEDSNMYVRIIDPQLGQWNNDEYSIYESLYAIVSIFKIEVAHSFLISLLRDYCTYDITKSMLLKMLHSIERFHFINNAICSNRSSGYDKLYAKNAQLLYQANNKEFKHVVIQNFIKELNSKVPQYSEYDSNFDSKLFYSSKDVKQKMLVQYVLNKIERKENKNAILTDVSLEHISPENPKKQILTDNNRIKDIGNLVLLDKELNSKIGNRDYKEKKALIQKESRIITTKMVFEKNKDWADEQISQRNKELRKILYNDVWKE